MISNIYYRNELRNFNDEEDEGYTEKDENQTALELYGTDITNLAREGKLDDCFGREEELCQLMEILVRRQKNNPVLVGDAGVGKTAIIELFATKLVNNMVPFVLEGRSIISLDLGRLVAGSRYRGEFEARFRNVLDEAISDPSTIIFIDEIHTLGGTGSAEGSLDAANMLKPILARNGFQCIGATTSKEYEKIEKDPALHRRFQPITVKEPTVEQTTHILYSLRSSLETFHNLEFSPSALKTAAELTDRYITDRFLPDKAIDLVDRTAAREVIKATYTNANSVISTIINAALVQVGRLKNEAYRRSDIASQFILQELESAYRNCLLTWVEDPDRLSSLGDPVASEDEEFPDKNLFAERIRRESEKQLKSPLSEELFYKMETAILTRAEELLFASRKPIKQVEVTQKISNLSAKKTRRIFSQFKIELQNRQSFLTQKLSKFLLLEELLGKSTVKKLFKKTLRLGSSKGLSLYRISIFLFFFVKHVIELKKTLDLDGEIYRRASRRTITPFFAVEIIPKSKESTQSIFITRTGFESKILNINVDTFKDSENTYCKKKLFKPTLSQYVFLESSTEEKKKLTQIYLDSKNRTINKVKTINKPTISSLMLREAAQKTSILARLEDQRIQEEYFNQIEHQKLIEFFGPIFAKYSSFGGYLQKMRHILKPKKKFLKKRKQVDFFKQDIEYIYHTSDFLSQAETLKISVVQQFLHEFQPIITKGFIQNLKSTSTFDINEEQLEKIYYLLGHYSSETGKDVLSNTNTSEIFNIAKQTGDFSGLKRRVTADNIKEVLSSLLGIPMQSINTEEKSKLQKLEENLHQRVIGQDDAISAIARAIRRARIGIQNPNRPIASFLFCGPTGVGKTEVCKALASVMFGSEKDMIRFDMSEFMEKFTISRLIGSPPGYVGYDEGGQLTDAIRKKPYSVVLFDEIEKAHPDVLNILLQILEDGRLTDTHKRLVSFENAMIVMTSNAGAADIQDFIANNPDIETEKELSSGKELKNSEKDPKLAPYLDQYAGVVKFLKKPYKRNFVSDLQDEIKTTFRDSLKNLKRYKEFEERIEKTIKKEMGRPLLATTSNASKNKIQLENKNLEQENEELTNEEKEQRERIEKANKNLKKTVLNRLGDFFLPEFLNRLDDIIIFKPLQPLQLRKICDLMINEVALRFKRKKVIVSVDDNVKLKLTEEGYNPAFGARPLRRLITRYVEDLVSDVILKNLALGEKEIYVTISLNEENEIYATDILQRAKNYSKLEKPHLLETSTN